MAIKARTLKESESPGKTALYKIKRSRDILVKEKQADGSLDQVVLEYFMQNEDVGYFANEYRPDGISKEGSKKIDITAVMQNHVRKCVRWHLYDIKDTLAGAETVLKLYAQWNAGLRYLRQEILNQMPEYIEEPNLGVITRKYDEKRMKRLRDDYQKRCDEIEKDQRLSLAQRKRRPEIIKYRGILKAAQAILDRNFQAENEKNTYKIQIRLMTDENDQIYKIRCPV